MNVTMADIAQKLAISVSTVSLALNNSTKVSAATREKVHAAAKELGYQANPYVSALMAARRRGKTPENTLVIALILAGDSPDEWKERYNTSQFIDGCTNVAKARNIRLEHFWIGDKTMTAKRLNEILLTRNIRGAVLLPAGTGREKMNHVWDGIATVSYGIYEIAPGTDWITGDYYGNMEKIRNILLAQDYKRIGFVMETPYPYRNDNRWLAAYRMTELSEQLEPWIDPEPSFEGFKSWLEKARPEVIICVRPAKVIEWLKRIGRGVPDDISIVTLGTAEIDSAFSGIVENALTCGKLALDMLLERIHHNEFGQLEFPHHVIIGGRWNRGKTLRYKDQ